MKTIKIGTFLKEVKLRDAWNEVCNQYLRRFCTIMDLPEEDAYWPGGDIGSVVIWEDGTAYNMDDIRYVVDHNIPKETVEAWWDYSYQIAYINSEYHALQNYKELPNVNLESYCKGARTLTKEQLDAEYDLIAKIQDAKDKFNTSIESYGHDTDIR